MKRTFGFLALISLFAAAASAQTFDWTAPDSVPNGKGYYVEVACWPYYPDDPGLKATLYKNGSFFATNTSDGGPNVIVGGYTTDTGPQTVHYEVDFWNNWELYWEGSDSRDVAISANQAPQVAFDWATSALANGGTLSGGGWAADPESGAPVNRVELFVDGVNRGNATLGGDRPDVSNAFGRSDYRYSGFNFSFGISGLAVGTHYVAVRAFDSLGAYTSQSRPFTINNTAPTVNVSGNRTSANVGDTVTLTLSGADVDSNLRAVNLWVKTPNTDWRNIRGDSTINGGYVENTTIDNAISSGGANVGSLGAVNRTFAFTLNEGFGTYQFHARSIDAKNATSATGVVNVTVANRAPTVSLSDPPYTIKQGETINLSSNAADADSNLATHHFWRRGPRTGNNFDDWNDWASDVGAPTGWSITNPGVPTGAGSSSKPAAFTPSSPGYYQFHVNAHDSAGENAGGATTHSVFVAPLPSSNISATVTNGTSASGSGTLFLHLGNTINVSSTATAAGWISEHAILRYTGTTSPSGVTGMAGGHLGATSAVQSNSISGSWAPTAAGSYTIYSEAFTGRSGGERVNGTSGYPGYFDGAANKRITINVSRSPTGSLQLLDTSKSAIAMTNGKWELPLGRQFYVRINGSDVDANLDQFYIRLNYPDSGQAYWANQVRDYGDAANGRRDYGPFTADRLGDWKVWGHVADAVARPWGSVTPWDGNANGWATFGQYTVSVINRAPDSVSVTVSATTISYGESVQITGTLTDPDGNLTKHALYVCPPKADGSSQFVPYIRPLNSAGFNSPEWTDGWSGGPWNNGFAMGGSTSVVGGTFKPNRAGVWGIHTNGTDVEGLGGPGGGHTVWVTVNKAANVITFNALPYRLTGDPAFTLAATASSGLPVSFVVVSGPVSLSNGTTLSLTGATGAVTIRATQPGNENYVAAVPVERSFTVYAATGDADGDGVENYIEREAGTDLTNPNDASIQLYEYDKTGRLKKGPGGEYIVDAEGNITEVKQ